MFSRELAPIQIYTGAVSPFDIHDIQIYIITINFIDIKEILHIV